MAMLVKHSSRNHILSVRRSLLPVHDPELRTTEVTTRSNAITFTERRCPPLKYRGGVEVVEKFANCKASKISRARISPLLWDLLRVTR